MPALMVWASCRSKLPWTCCLWLWEYIGSFQNYWLVCFCAFHVWVWSFWIYFLCLWWYCHVWWLAIYPRTNIPLFDSNTICCSMCMLKYGVNVRDAVMNILYIFPFAYSVSVNVSLNTRLLFLKLFPYNSVQILFIHKVAQGYPFQLSLWYSSSLREENLIFLRLIRKLLK